MSTHRTNAERLLPSQRKLLAALVRSPQQVYFLLLDPEKLIDLLWLVNFEFVELVEDGAKLFASITLPGRYAHSLGG